MEEARQSDRRWQPTPPPAAALPRRSSPSLPCPRGARSRTGQSHSAPIAGHRDALLGGGGVLQPQIHAAARPAAELPFDQHQPGRRAVVRRCIPGETCDSRSPFSTRPASSTGPISVSISCRDIIPGRSRRGGETASERTVDSMPTVVGPPSRIRSTRSPRASRTCSAVVGESWPKRLALGAAMGTPASRIKARASGCAGMRIPTVARPAVTMSGTCGRLGSTSVRGPGQ